LSSHPQYFFAHLTFVCGSIAARVQQANADGSLLCNFIYIALFSVCVYATHGSTELSAMTSGSEAASIEVYGFGPLGSMPRFSPVATDMRVVWSCIMPRMCYDARQAEGLPSYHHNTWYYKKQWQNECRWAHVQAGWTRINHMNTYARRDAHIQMQMQSFTGKDVRMSEAVSEQPGRRAQLHPAEA